MSEKWIARESPYFKGNTQLVKRGEVFTVEFHPYYIEHEPTAKEKAEEFCSLLNAMAGIKDPEGWMEKVKEFVHCAVLQRDREGYVQLMNGDEFEFCLNEILPLFPTEAHDES